MAHPVYFKVVCHDEVTFTESSIGMLYSSEPAPETN